VTLLRYHCSYTRALAFLHHVKPLLRLVPYDDSVRSQAEDVFRRLGSDKKLSWCDIISFVVVTMLLNNMVCLSFDRDFKQLGLTVIS
jgi:predicted nucleic acid-binding protein